MAEGAERWRVLITIELERIREVRGGSPGAALIVSKQTSTFGAIEDSPAEAFRVASSEGFSAYTEGLPEGERISRVGEN